MKQILIRFRVLSAIALVALAAGCANIQSKEDSLIAAGFRVVVPKTAAQQQRLKTLPADKVTMVQRKARRITFSPTRRTTKPTWVAQNSIKLTASCV